MKSDKMVNLFLDILELWQLSNMHHCCLTFSLKKRMHQMIKVLILRRLKKKFVNRLIESDRKLVFPEILYFYDASMKNRAIQDYLRVLS